LEKKEAVRSGAPVVRDSERGREKAREVEEEVEEGVEQRGRRQDEEDIMAEVVMAAATASIAKQLPATNAESETEDNLATKKIESEWDDDCPTPKP